MNATGDGTSRLDGFIPFQQHQVNNTEVPTAAPSLYHLPPSTFHWSSGNRDPIAPSRAPAFLHNSATSAWGQPPAASPPPPMTPPHQNMVVVSILIALISLLCIILAFVTIPPVMHMIRRKMPIPQARIDRRYATIDGWLITKRVQPHDAVCECIRHRYCKTIQAETSDSNSNSNSDSPSDSSSSSSSSSSHKEGTVSSDERQHSAEALVRKKKKSKSLTITAAILLEKLAPASTQDKNEEGEEENTPGIATAGTNSTEEMADSSDDASAKGPSSADIDVESPPDEETTQDDENSIEKPACAICLEAFRIHDTVSWSTNPHCGHVFHHACIREWLLRRVGCPCCRKVVLPVDRPLVQRQRQQQQQRARQRQRQQQRRTTVRETDEAEGTEVPSHATIPLGGESEPESADPTRQTERRRQGSFSPSSFISKRNGKRVSNKMFQKYARERAKRTTTSYYCIQEGLITLHGFGLLDSSKKHKKTSKEQEKSQNDCSSSNNNNNGSPADATANQSSSKPEQAIVRPARNPANGRGSDWMDTIWSSLPMILQRYRIQRPDTDPTRESSSSGRGRRDGPDRTFLQDNDESSQEEEEGGSQELRRQSSDDSIELVFEPMSNIDDDHHPEDPEDQFLLEEEEQPAASGFGRIAMTGDMPMGTDPHLILTTDEFIRVTGQPPPSLTVAELMAELSSILAMEL